MYQILTFLHATFRWLVIASLLLSISRAYIGYSKNKLFTRNDNAARHWTATIAHIQLMLGILFYTQSPIVKYFRNHFSEAVQNPDALFFGLIHITLMIVAVVMITIGSSLAKRKLSDRDKFKTMLTYYSIAFLIIFIAIPWPFSPLASRPYFR